MTTAGVDQRLRPIWRQALNVGGYLLVITVNALANALPINGITSGAVSDMFPTWVTPAGYVFAIWGLIYALLGVFVVYQALPANRDDERLQRLGGAFALSCVWNATWLLAWHNLLIPLAWALIVALLVTLVVCYERLRGAETSRTEWLAVRLPFSVYLGWVTIATVANTAILFVAAGIDGDPWWGAVALLAATGVTLTMLVRRRDVVFALVAIWAFVGIAVAQGARSDVIAVTATSLAALVTVAVGVLAATARRRST